MHSKPCPKVVICKDKETSETSTQSSFWVYPIADVPATCPTLVICSCDPGRLKNRSSALSRWRRCAVTQGSFSDDSGNYITALGHKLARLFTCNPARDGQPRFV
jgi:hypothetical protein